MHGYELRKQLAQKLGLFWTVSFGSLYPTLKKLERRGVVERAGRTDGTPRRKTVYAITASGETAFLEMLAEGAGAADEDKFPLRLAFFSYLRPETRIRLLTRRRDYLQERLDDRRSSLGRATRGRGVDSYTVSLVRHGLETTERDIVWVDELIATERRLLREETDGGGPARPGGPRLPGPTPAASPAPRDDGPEVVPDPEDVGGDVGEELQPR